MKNVCTFFQRVSVQIACKKKGIPWHLLSLFRRQISFETKGSLYRRSKDHELKKHWSETRLGEISVNWSRFCSRPQYALLDSRKDTPLYFESFTKVAICDLDQDYKPELICKLEDEKGFLLVKIDHDPLDCNYSHCNINCYLTTYDGEYNNSLVPHDGYDKHPLKKKLKGLRSKYKAHLLYHFQDN